MTKGRKVHKPDRLPVDVFVTRAAAGDAITLFALPTEDRHVGSKESNAQTKPAPQVGTTASGAPVFLGVKRGSVTEIARGVNWSPILFRKDNKQKKWVQHPLDQAVLTANGEDLNQARWMHTDDHEGIGKTDKECEYAYKKYMSALYFHNSPPGTEQAMLEASTKNSTVSKAERSQAAGGKRSKTPTPSSSNRTLRIQSPDATSTGIERELRSAFEQPTMELLSVKNAHRAEAFLRLFPDLKTPEQIWTAYNTGAIDFDFEDRVVVESIQAAWMELSGGDGGTAPSQDVLKNSAFGRKQTGLTAAEDVHYFRMWVQSSKNDKPRPAVASVQQPEIVKQAPHQAWPTQDEDNWYEQFEPCSEMRRRTINWGPALLGAVGRGHRYADESM